MLFTDNLVFEGIFYKGASKIPPLFKIVLRFYQVHMIGYLILNIVHIAGTIIIETVVDWLLRGNKLGLIIRGLNQLQFVSLYQGVVERSTTVGLWLRLRWVNSFSRMSPSGWFELKGDNLLWATPPPAADTALELVLEARLQHPYKSHYMVVPRLMKFLWRKDMEKEADLLFTVPFWVPFWGLG